MANKKHKISVPTPDERTRMVDEAVKALNLTPDTKSHEQLLLDHMQEVVKKVRNDLRYHVAHTPGALSVNPANYTEFISSRFIDYYRGWDKESLLFALCYLQTGVFIEME